MFGYSKLFFIKFSLVPKSLYGNCRILQTYMEYKFILRTRIFSPTPSLLLRPRPLPRLLNFGIFLHRKIKLSPFKKFTQNSKITKKIHGRLFPISLSGMAWYYDNMFLCETTNRTWRSNLFLLRLKIGIFCDLHFCHLYIFIIY